MELLYIKLYSLPVSGILNQAIFQAQVVIVWILAQIFDENLLFESYAHQQGSHPYMATLNQRQLDRLNSDHRCRT